MKLRPALFLLLALSLLLFAPTPASAQSDKTVTVKQRDADITIQTNGDVQFVETWVVDFQNGPFTFAFREIPKNKLRDIVNISVTESGKTLTTETSDIDGATKITWYFDSTNQGTNFFSDVHTFVLHYTIQGAMRIYPDGDQFWWKFVESDRAYTIESAHATVHLPATFPTDKLLATTYTNSTDTGGGQIRDGQTIAYSGGPFPPQTGWEIRAQFPHTITAPPEEWQKFDDRIDQLAAQNNFYSVIIGVILLVGGPLFLLLLWYLFGRDKPTTFTTEFLNAPPDDTPPGVVGTLLDERADLQDILATVADLAQRGYLTIREADAFGSPEYARTDKSTSDLAPFEQQTLDALLRGNAMRRLEDVRGSFCYYINALQGALYQEVVDRGFFPRSPWQTRDLYFAIGKWGAVITPLVGLCAYGLAFIFAPLAFFPILALEFFFIGLLGVSRVMPQRTPTGSLAFAKWNAFKRYLASIEKYTEVSKAQDQFSKYLPYTIAFGLEKSWIEKFQQTPTPAPTWYVPYNQSSDNGSWNTVNDDRTASTATGGTLFPNSPAPIFYDSAESNPHHLPSLNDAANSSFLALNNVSSNMFSFLNTSADAFTARPATPSTSEQVLGGIGSFLNWVSTNSGSSSSSGGGGWSGGSSSSSSSSSGGGGGGGGSSGFG